jgi:hypothetical protein
MNTNKAHYGTDESGLWLRVPNEGNAPALFLEWLGDEQYPLAYLSILNHPDYFHIVLDRRESCYRRVTDYINNNLPEEQHEAAGE